MVLDGHESVVHPNNSIEVEAPVAGQVTTTVKMYKSKAHQEADRPHKVVVTHPDGSQDVKEYA